MSRFNGNLRTKLAGYVAFGAEQLFFNSYIMQISGISIFLVTAFPDTFELWVQLLFYIMIVIVKAGGLRAIMYSTLQESFFFYYDLDYRLGASNTSGLLNRCSNAR
jgi:hypothetical protein